MGVVVSPSNFIHKHGQWAGLAPNCSWPPDPVVLNLHTHSFFSYLS